MIKKETDSLVITDTIRHIAGLAITYTLGDIFVKGLNYLLLPLYLQYLPPEEFGILAITEVLKIILGLVLSFGMMGAILRFIHTVDDKDRRSFFGSIWVFLILGAGLVTTLLLLVGPAIFPKLIPSVAFAPYISKTILAAFLNSSFGLLPATLFRARDKAKQYVIFGLFSSLSIALVTIIRVVILRQEAAGWVQAQIEGAIGIAVIGSIILLKEVRPSFNWQQLKSVLIFALPLVPHVAAHWILSVSDRMILEDNVGLAQLGLYTLGYQFGQGYQVFVTGINNALIPMFGRASRESTARQMLPRMITYYLLIVSIMALIFALIGGEVILLLFPSNYQGAVPIVPWIILGYFAFAVYYIPVNHISITIGETRTIPLATLTAAFVNLALNLIFIPRYGIIAAAVNTAIGYGVLALSMLILSRRTSPPPLENRRIAKLISCSVLLYTIAFFLMRFDPLRNIAIAIGLALTLPFILALIGFWSREELQLVRRASAAVVGRFVGVKR